MTLESLPDTPSELTSLLDTLQDAVSVFKDQLHAQNLHEPSLRTSKPHPTDDVTYLPPPAMHEARRIILATIAQIKYLVENPHEAVFASAFMTLEASSIRLAADIGIADVLAAAPDPEQGLSTEEFSTRLGVNPSKLEGILRLLVSQGWFRESKQGCFANNRRSNLIKKDLPGYHLATYMNGIFHRVSEKLPDQINHPDEAFRNASDPIHTAFNLSHNTDLPYFGPNSWVSENPGDAQKFALAMGGAGPTSDPGIAADFPWADVANGKDAIIDVGGGQGTLCCSLAIRYPEINRFVVQDLPVTRTAAEQFIRPKGLSDRVSFEEQDFFASQQRKGTGHYVYVMQRVLHDWSTEDGAKILAQIREALDPNSRFFIIETIIEPGTLSIEGMSAKTSLAQFSQGLYGPAPPPPLIPANFGDAGKIPHLVSVALTAMHNAKERTLVEWQAMIALAGLEIERIHRTRGWASIIEVGPINAQ